MVISFHIHYLIRTILKTNFLLAIVCVVLGIAIGLSFKGCGDATLSEPKIEYIERIVNVPYEKIKYLPGEVTTKTIYKIKNVPGETIYVLNTD